MKLPIRSASHIAESSSKKILLGLLPDEWVVRDVMPDYGIDLNIEVWHEGKPIGRSVNVQLKSISNFEKQTKGILRVTIKTSTLNYLDQYHPSFLVSIYDKRSNTISIMRIKEILKIFLPVIETKESTSTITIPMVYFRETYDSDWYYAWCNYHPSWKTVFSLGGLGGFSQRQKRVARYFTFFENEDEFWRREAFANLGYYISIFRPQLKKRAVDFLIRSFFREKGLGIIGIMESFYYLDYLSPEISEIAVKWLNCENAQKVLVAAHYLGSCKNEKYIKLIENTFYSRPKSIIKENEFKALLRVLEKASEGID